MIPQLEGLIRKRVHSCHLPTLLRRSLGFTASVYGGGRQAALSLGPAAAPLERLHAAQSLRTPDVHIVSQLVRVRENWRAHHITGQRSTSRGQCAARWRRAAAGGQVLHSVSACQNRSAYAAKIDSRFRPRPKSGRVPPRSARVCRLGTHVVCGINNVDTTHMYRIDIVMQNVTNVLDIIGVRSVGTGGRSRVLSPEVSEQRVDLRGPSPSGRGRRAREDGVRRGRLGQALSRPPSLRVLSLAYPVRLQLMVDEVVLGLAFLAAVLAREPVVAVGLRVHIEHMLAQVGRGGVDAAAERALGPVAGQRHARPAR
ncbi:hypothetical protein EVAR_38804_1 [Eumeta japonica]|uniref:Uncharacterized protein n=1 Tax=Eumeta variegata TaxID=151549 RepID=A0A4C1WKN5_EUMVA|nr:hypothetical protein EVAR_38804_1 [Eumeta japonica]